MRLFRTLIARAYCNVIKLALFPFSTSHSSRFFAKGVAGFVGRARAGWERTWPTTEELGSSSPRVTHLQSDSKQALSLSTSLLSLRGKIRRAWFLPCLSWFCGSMIKERVSEKFSPLLVLSTAWLTEVPGRWERHSIERSQAVEGWWF